ncbi:retron Ec48 family effector membrane protein [Aeromonas veronii]|uniref:retron Ec48 family effector membrane protein n=1 Tax=Aeromonas veronii TaxID=654 RepID=UPI003D1FD2B6
MKLPTDKSAVSILLIIMAVSTALILIFCVLYVLFIDGLYQKSFCFDAKCIKTFLKAYEVIPTAINSVVQFFSYLFAVFGVYFALKTYISNLEALKTNIHLSHQNTFRSYIEMEIAKFDRISGKSLNLFRWYNLAFPESPSGNISVSPKYVLFIEEINRNINESNDESSTSPNGVCFDYKKHQGKMIRTLNKIGIKTNRMPRNSFYEIEGAIIDFIDQVNLEFFRMDPRTCKIASRRYR